MVVPATVAAPRGASTETARLFEAHSERIFGYCLRFLGTRSDAEDALQTTFLYAQRALERGVQPSLEYAWLHSIAKNVCRWQLRTLARRGSLTTEVDLDALPSPAPVDTEVNELRGELEEALASIPETQRKALLLREWHGLESNEIATRLGMTPTATYALLTRARRSVVKALNAAGSRPVLGVDFVGALGKLKALLGGGTAKVVATTAAVGTVAIGGVAVERATEIQGRSQQPATPAIEDVDQSVRTRSAALATQPRRFERRTEAAGGRTTPGRRVRSSNPSLLPVSAEHEASTDGPVEPAGGSGSADVPSRPPVRVQGPADKVEKPRLELPVVKDVVDPLLDDPLAIVPPVDVELPVDEVAPPLSEVEEDVENVLETPLPDITPPLPKLPLP